MRWPYGLDLGNGLGGLGLVQRITRDTMTSHPTDTDFDSDYSLFLYYKILKICLGVVEDLKKWGVFAKQNLKK